MADLPNVQNIDFGGGAAYLSKKILFHNISSDCVIQVNKPFPYDTVTKNKLEMEDEDEDGVVTLQHRVMGIFSFPASIDAVLMNDHLNFSRFTGQNKTVLPSVSWNYAEQVDFNAILTGIKSLTISDFSCKHMRSFKIRGLNQLESLSIGSMCFYPGVAVTKMTDPTDASVFEIADCLKLSKVQINNWSFVFTTSFTLFSMLPIGSLIDLPLLDNLTIGNVTSKTSAIHNSDCFYFVKELILSDLPSLASVSLGNMCFFKCEKLVLYSMTIIV